MKDEAQELKDLLLKIGTFFKEQGDDGWAQTLINGIDYVDADLKEAKRIMRRWYGGMGSLNDIVFDEDGVPAVELNNKFCELRRKLSDIISIYS